MLLLKLNNSLFHRIIPRNWIHARWLVKTLLNARLMTFTLWKWKHLKQQPVPGHDHQGVPLRQVGLLHQLPRVVLVLWGAETEGVRGTGRTGHMKTRARAGKETRRLHRHQPSGVGIREIRAAKRFNSPSPHHISQPGGGWKNPRQLIDGRGSARVCVCVDWMHLQPAVLTSVG